MSPPAVSRSTFAPVDVALFLALSSMWGLSFLFIKVAVGQLSPMWVVAGRTTVGAAVLLVILRARGRWLPPAGRFWVHLLVLATLGNAIPWALVAYAQRSLPSGLTAVVNSLVPVSTLVVAAAVGLEHMRLHRVAGLVLALLGTGVVVSGELGTPGRLVAVFLVAGATLMYGASAVYAKRYVSGRQRPLAVATGQVLLAAVLSAPVAYLLGPTPHWSELRPTVLGAVAALGAFGTGLAFLLFYLLIERVGATNATMTTYVIPVVAVLAGWLFLEERLGLNVLVGAIGILVGVWLAQRRRIVTADEELEELPR